MRTVSCQLPACPEVMKRPGEGKGREPTTGLYYESPLDDERQSWTSCMPWPYGWSRRERTLSL